MAKIKKEKVPLMLKGILKEKWEMEVKKVVLKAGQREIEVNLDGGALFWQKKGREFYMQLFLKNRNEYKKIISALK